MYGTKTNTQKALQMLRQTEGTIGKTISFVQDDKYCIDIIQQIDSAIGTLKKAKKELLGGHLKNCFLDELSKNKPKAVEELLKVYKFT